MKFQAACAFVLKWEGQISDSHGDWESPSDPGGLTKFGISSRFFPEVRKREFSEADAIAIYKEKYWTACKCEELPEALAFMLFDAAVNQGQTQAIRMLQRTLNIPADGIVGPETVAAAGLAVGVTTLADFAARRTFVYGCIPTFQRFGLGWQRRAIACLIQALTMAPVGARGAGLASV